MFGATFWMQMVLQALAASAVFLTGMGLMLGGAAPGAERLLVFAGLAGAVALATAGASNWLAENHRRTFRREPRPCENAGGQAHDPVRYDALTGLLTRSAFLERLRLLLEGRRHGDGRLAVLLLDLVDFQGINRTLGHAAGDLLLRHAGARLLASLRETDVLARMIADEFAIIQAAGDSSATTRLCERLLTAMEAPFDLHGRETYVKARIGVALSPKDGCDPDALLEQAGRALDLAKRQGRRFRCVDQGTDDDLRQRTGLEANPHQLLERGALESR